MTAVRRARVAPVSPLNAGTGSARVLTDADLPDVHRQFATDPIGSAVVQARIEREGTLTPRLLGAEVIGIENTDGLLVACCYNGGNLVPISGAAEELAVIAGYLTTRPRNCTSIVGRADSVAALWEILSNRWAPPRAVRAVQPLLATDTVPQAEASDALRLAGPADIENYLAAAAAMFTEELGVSPYRQVTRSAYRQRVEALVRSDRALVITDRRGVVFKAELAAITAQTCQVQGVWVRPRLRGHGIAAAAMSGVVAYALGLAPTVSLYVNDFNTPARRLYDGLGLREIGTISTILL